MRPVPSFQSMPSWVLSVPFFSGFLSDKLFNGRRNMPAFIFGAIYTLSIAMFVLTPANPVIDIISMALFGLSLGVLLVYLGGLMAVDICSKETSGTALGVVGVASYLWGGATGHPQRRINRRWQDHHQRPSRL